MPQSFERKGRSNAMHMTWKIEPYEFTTNKSSEAPFNRFLLSRKMTSCKDMKCTVKEKSPTS
jgi:hypothetical protein